MNVELVVFGLIAIAIGIALLYAARHLYPRLELVDEALASVRLLTAIIVALLLLGGLGLVLVGALM
ncbi:hypothetical protein [Natrarchaeobaculum sulfurireducens]|uniref:Beta-ketoadipyl CoA thiolase n=1 Tax=Natrarchaeobaculum sulfurireducens TaxID=2044521 RepID=A0A346PUH7_9EURY|nr:hypothetical protein [Natrarchaeobaculum sulfurireducens]AXR79402.1 hypothetical protein AArc1_3096 [Natrarchaeobaculum sulfurireducens]AXR83172.1 hypothetical protein AArcMg_3187 [Natrarchaeobaculum sulfurireducens]